MFNASAESIQIEVFAPMSSKLLLEQPAPVISIIPESAVRPPTEKPESLFEHVAWFYVFCRENLFRDDTERLSKALWPDAKPPSGAELLEIGCGPGFYARRFARRYPQISVTGMDRSEQQLRWARARAESGGLGNCKFERVDILNIKRSESHYDALIASRLFTVLTERERAIAEMYRVLKHGGRCIIAEPRHAFRASIPLIAMWILARMTRSGDGYCEPHRATVLSHDDLSRLCATQPWKRFECWEDGRYQYALCEKA